MDIREIMTKPVFTIRTTDTVHQAAELMALHSIGVLPVCEDGELVGMLTDRDVVVRCLAPGLDPYRTQVQWIMSPDPMAVGADQPIGEAARKFSSLRVRRLPVVEGRRPVGILSVDDVARFWDDDQAILNMLRRVAPPHRERLPGA